MIVGVDAGALSVRDDRLKVGVYRVTLNLLKYLSLIDITHEYRLYSFIPIETGVMSSFGHNMRNVIVRPAFGWSQIQLPLELRRHPVDVFLGLSQMIPSTNAIKIGLIHDLGFLSYPDLYEYSRRKLKTQTETLAYRTDKIIAVSKATKRDILSHYDITPDKVIVCYEGIDTRFVPLGEVYKPDRPYFLFVGALKKQKNIPMLLQSFRKFLDVSKKTYDLLLVGGDYWIDPEINETMTTLKLHERVKITGYIKDEDLPKYYRGAVAFVSPSLIEGFCLPAVEAMASGCPVICSSVGAFPEIVGEAGIMIDPTHVDVLAKTLVRVSKDSSLRLKMREHGLKKSKQFTWKIFASNVYALYKNLDTATTQ